MKLKLLICLLALPLLIFSQEKKKYQTWIVTDEQSFEGMILKLEKSSILFKVDDLTRNHNISEINKIKFFRKNEGNRGAIRGGLIGGGAGLLIGAVTGTIIDGLRNLCFSFSGDCPSTPKIKSRLTNTLGGAGLLTGAILGVAINSEPKAILIKKSQKKYDRNKKRLKKLIGTEH